MRPVIPPGYRQLSVKMGLTDELAVRMPQEHIREYVARESSHLLEKALLDGLDMDAPMWFHGEQEYDAATNAHYVVAMLFYLPQQTALTSAPGAEKPALDYPQKRLGW